MLSLWIAAPSYAGGAIEAGSNIGTSAIDKIILREGYNPVTFPPGESSPLSKGIRAHLMERAKEGGPAAAELALSEAGAACVASADQVHRCEIRRYRILRSADLIGAKYGRTDWIVSISYGQRGNSINNVHVAYSESYELTK
jgi:hypothetical protein